MTDEDEHRFFDILAIIIRALDIDSFSASCFGYNLPGPFPWSWQMLDGIDKLILLYLENPDFVHRLANVATASVIANMGIAIDNGADFIVMVSDMAYSKTALMSADHRNSLIC